MPTITRDGTTLYFECSGSGRPVLLSHGYSGTGRMWDQQVDELSTKCRVITWDMRGHARSDSPDAVACYSEAEAVADMEAILDACDAQDAVIGGLALGGYLSLCFYIAHRERTQALILVGTGPGYRKDSAREAWNISADTLADGLDANGLDALKEVVWGRHPLHRSATGLALAARGMLRQSDAHVLESLPTVTVPTLIVVGERDVDFIAPSNYMTNKISGATQVIIPAVGHGCNMDSPKDFNDAVLAFLNTLPEPAETR
jgi:pimeloyl-ACP methyl ester carboxylesterase